MRIRRLTGAACSSAHAVASTPMATAAGYPSKMVDERASSTTPTLDEWIDEVGEPGVLEAVEALKTAIGNGTATVLRDKESLDHRRIVHGLSPA